MRGKIILEEHICMPEEVAKESTKFASRNAQDLARALLDLHDDRLKEMNENGVEFAIISQNTPGPQGITDPKEAADYAARSNDYISSLVERAPERFAAFGVVSMHSAEEAVAELTRCVENLGCVGVMLHDSQLYLDGSGRLREYYYDDRRYDLFWAGTEKLKVPVYLHPKLPLPEEVSRLYGARPWLLGPVYSYARDTSFHALAICTSGVFDRYPGVKLVLGHLGESPILCSRLFQY
jgi:gamma-resorcylate decarboxylase